LYLESSFKWLKEEIAEKGLTIEPADLSDWTRHRVNIPQQTNGTDCGVFVLCVAECLSEDKFMNFKEADMKRKRGLIAASYIAGQVLV
jgi:Ulp1 family protease